MLKPLAEVVEPGADFFVEDIALTAIVFDANDDDVTLWVTTIFDDELHFFHLAATFSDLSTLLRLAGERGPDLELEIANALSGNSDDSPEPAAATAAEASGPGDDATAEETAEAEKEDEDGPLFPTLFEFVTEDRPPVLLPGVALKLAFTYTDETDTEAVFNIFSLEGIYLHLP